MMSDQKHDFFSQPTQLGFVRFYLAKPYILYQGFLLPFYSYFKT